MSKVKRIPIGRDIQIRDFSYNWNQKSWLIDGSERPETRDGVNTLRLIIPWNNWEESFCLEISDANYVENHP